MEPRADHRHLPVRRLLLAIGIAILGLTGCGGGSGSPETSAEALATEPTAVETGDGQPAATTDVPAEPTATVELAEPAVLEPAEAFVEAFYSFDAAALEEVTVSMYPWQATIVEYYQRWVAAGGNVVIERGQCEEVGDRGTVECTAQIKEFAADVLGVDVVTTETMTLEVRDGEVDEVAILLDEGKMASLFWVGDDPVVRQAFSWLRANRIELYLDDGPCAEMFREAGTPGECARAMTHAFEEFALERGPF